MSCLVGRTRTRIYSVERLRISTTSPKQKRLYSILFFLIVLVLSTTKYDFILSTI